MTKKNKIEQKRNADTMNMISLYFWIFIAIGTLIYYTIPKKTQWLWLLFMSIFFYASTSIKLSVFILGSIVTSYIYTRFMRNKIGLIFVIFGNAFVLLFLKYCAFGGGLFASFIPVDRFALLVPLGISFYTLQVISYCVDVYHKKVVPEKNIFKYALFVSFFPQILQGPIPRFEQLHAQFFKVHKFEYEKVTAGLQLMIWGYFQKMVIADRAAIVVDRLFGEYETYKGFYVLLAGFLYSIQLYTDFAGCVCIALGTAQLFGITLSDNFKHPYFAVSVKDFWSRWHITLSSWLKDYIYIPLGGNKKGKVRKYGNIMITFLVSGLWHGMGLHYFVWGLLHGVYQVIEDMATPVTTWFDQKVISSKNSFSHKLGKQLLTFFCVMIAWIFFRASSVSMAITMLKNMVTEFNPYIFFNDDLYLLGLDDREFHLLLISIVVLWFVSMLQNKYELRTLFAKQTILFRWIILFIALFSIIIGGIYGPAYDANQFIYGAF